MKQYPLYALVFLCTLSGLVHAADTESPKNKKCASREEILSKSIAFRSQGKPYRAVWHESIPGIKSFFGLVIAPTPPDAGTNIPTETPHRLQTENDPKIFLQLCFGLPQESFIVLKNTVCLATGSQTFEELSFDKPPKPADMSARFLLFSLDRNVAHLKEILTKVTDAQTLDDAVNELSPQTGEPFAIFDTKKFELPSFSIPFSFGAGIGISPDGTPSVSINQFTFQ